MSKILKKVMIINLPFKGVYVNEKDLKDIDIKSSGLSYWVEINGKEFDLPELNRSGEYYIVKLEDVDPEDEHKIIRHLNDEWVISYF